MNVVSFLKKAGSVILAVGKAAAGIEPIAVSLLPQQAGIISTVINDLNQMCAVVVSAEAFGQSLSLSGQDKLKAAIPLMGQVILKTDLMVGKKVKQQELYEKAVAEYTQATVDLLNSLDESGVG